MNLEDDARLRSRRQGHPPLEGSITRVEVKPQTEKRRRLGRRVAWETLNDVRPVIDVSGAMDWRRQVGQRHRCCELITAGHTRALN